MSYKVTVPLAIIADENGENPRYFYQDTVLPDGLDKERLKVLADEGALEKVKAPEAPKAEAKSDKVDDILADVGDDKDKAAAALAVEEEKGDKARKTLVEPLQSILGKA